MAIKASGSITLTRVNDGSTGQGVSSITAQYYLSSSKTIQTGGGWLDTPPVWVRGKYMWTRNKIVYKNPTDTAYTSPICDSSWEVANEVVEIANGKNTIYIATSAPPVTGKKVNDIWYDSDDGYRMYNFNGSTWIAIQFGTNAILANAITAEKISANAIVSGKILAGAVTTDKLAALNVTAEKIAANAITAGKIAANAITAGNIQANAVTTDKLYAKAVTSVKIDTEELFVGDNAFIRKLKAVDIDAANINTGTISNDRINITGLISFEAFDKTLQPIFNVQGDKTYINGGMIATNTIKADKIDLLSGLTVQGANGKPVFNISRIGDTDNGTIEIDGLLKSGNFDEAAGLGYKIDTDGTAVLNQARISGEVILPNAGMTNYGSVVGGENYLIGTDKVLTQPTASIPMTYVLEDIKNLRKKTVTVSVDIDFVDATRSVGSTAYRAGCETAIMFEDGTYLYCGAWSPINTTVTNRKERLKVTYTVADKPIKGVVACGMYIQGLGSGSISIGNVKLEEGAIATPWCPHKSEQSNYVRMWAGSDFDTRDTAPFRVYQNGDVFASKGTYSGLLRGELDSGDVQIYDNAITVHNPGTETEVVNIAANRSVFNTDFIMGSNKVVYSKGNNKLSLQGTTLDVDSAGGRVVVTPDATETGGLNVFGPTGGQHVMRGSTTASKSGSLFFDSQGTSSDYGDFLFVRKNQKEDVKVVVDGDLTVKNKINSPGNTIELRVKSDGWGFYAI